MNVQVKNEIPRCPGAPTFQEIMRSDGGIVKDVLAAQSNPPQSREDIPFEKYISQDFFNLEMKKVWEKVWQYVCREDQVVEEVRRYFPHRMFGTVVPRSVRLAEAPSYGQAIVEYDASSRGAEAYEAFVAELVSRLQLSPRPRPNAALEGSNG